MSVIEEVAGPATETVRAARRQQDKLLWVMNVAAIGGSALWVFDALASMPNWRHEVVFVHGAEDPRVGERFREHGVAISYAPLVTRKIVEAVAPAAVILSNTDPNKLEGEHPWSWLMDGWPVVSVHHSPVRPWIPGAVADVFVSRHLFSMYEGIADRMRRTIVVPPGIDTALYARIERPAAHGRCVIGRHASGGEAKFPPELLGIVARAGVPAILVGGAEHYPPTRQVSFPPIGSRAPVDILRDLDVFLYHASTTETWCRAVTEAMAAGLPCVADRRGGIVEQIEDGVTGFLCETEEEFDDRLRLLIANPGLRFEMGMRARVAALQHFDVRRFRDEIEPLLLRLTRS